MNTLIITGSARKKGHTNNMVDILVKKLDGNIEFVDAYELQKEKNISPCLDCRFCWKTPNCCIKDDMQEIYEKIEWADNIVFATPMYFHTVTAPLKIIIDRCQVYWASWVRKDKKEIFSKNGIILMSGGAPSFEEQFLAGEIVLKGVLGDINANYLGKVVFPNTDRDNILTNKEKINEIEELALILNKKYEEGITLI
ncbi:flavoprotein [Candidatus Epulonipiscium fishelsonii]|uniref:Flavoprotein n=1 Tax=Candidatus Epulonipiscium fishelsonii TaxID=77094 RepID=A0ACC8XBK7_9FIRM|nr:flavoprotein [Epulopiscium sp. SCG-B11WGA-EpuloA1]ONI41302.1 flavoprotein [Epulopiscium sp. SCG-B05WGA-EpuloA1]